MSLNGEEMAFMWSKESSMKLIQLYHKSHILWDPKHIGYKNRSEKEETWKEIGVTMNVDMNEVQRKMKNILTQYCRERQKYKKLRKEGRGETFRTSWFAYKSLQFLSDKNKVRSSLKGAINPKRGGASTYDLRVDNKICKDISVTCIEMTPLFPQPNQKQTLYSKSESAIPVLVNSKISDQQTWKANTPSKEEYQPVIHEQAHKDNVWHAAKEEDEFDVFARGVAIQMRNLPPLVAYDIELQITTLLTNAKRDQVLINMQQNLHPTLPENTSTSSMDREPEREHYMIAFSPKVEPNDEY